MKRKARRRHGTNDSFDLFLDTITNTFGGILLLALLLVLMIRETAEVATETPDHGSRASLTEDLSQLAQEKQNLLDAAAIRNSLSQQGNRDNSIAIANQISVLFAKEKEFQKTKTALDVDLESMRSLLANSKATAAKLEAEIVAKNTTLDDLLEKLLKAQELRTRTMPTPKEKITQKPMTVAIVKNKQVFFLDKSRANEKFAVNQSHFNKTTESKADIVLMDGTALKTIVSSGLPADQSYLDREFAKVNTEYHIALAVWQDSFEEFSQVRKACVKAGLEYQIMVIEKGPIFETRGAGPSRSQ